MKITLNKSKSIGNVLFIVEGNRTEPYILHRIFTKIFDYDFQTKLRVQGNQKSYRQYNSKENPTSRVFVINTEESNIKFIDKDNEYLNNLFIELIENYDFNVDNSAIYYLFDRDNQSNTDVGFYRSMLTILQNSRDNADYDRQGVLLISYPSIESFTLSNFEKESYRTSFRLGSNVKKFLNEHSYNHQDISSETLKKATYELFGALKEIGVDDFNIDDLGSSNLKVFDYEEAKYQKEELYIALSTLCIALIDLGIIEISEN